MPGQWPELVEETKEKKPAEILPLAIDFNPRLAAEDTFAANPVQTCVKEWGPGGQLTIDPENFENGVWSGLVAGGDAPADHRLKVLVPTSNGHMLGHTVVLEIRT